MGALLKETFLRFCQVGVPGAKNMTGKNFVKLCKDAGLVDNKKVTTTDVDIEFSKRIPKGQKMGYKEFKLSIEVLSRRKDVDVQTVFQKISDSAPAMNGVTRTSKTGGVERMTDGKNYTGTQRIKAPLEKFGVSEPEPWSNGFWSEPEHP